jgi:GntR family transcriptional regulator, histidine utilization repressor
MPHPSALDRLDRRTALPLYRQIKDDIAARIKAGVWQAGRRLPSENELVETLGVSRMTINRALRELTRDGMLVRVHGVGTFVAEPRRHASLVQLRDIAEEIREAGRSHRLEVLLLESTHASPMVAQRMQTGRGGALFHLKAVHFQDDIPVLFEDRFVNPRLAPDFLAADFSRVTATGYLVDLITPDEMEHVVQAVLPVAEVAAALNIERSEPCLKLSRRTFKADTVVTAASLYYPGSRYSLGARYATGDYDSR